MLTRGYSEKDERPAIGNVPPLTCKDYVFLGLCMVLITLLLALWHLYETPVSASESRVSGLGEMGDGGASGAESGARVVGEKGVVAIITLHSVATVVGPDILLGEIADIAVMDDELLGRLQKLPVGRAALAGSERTLSAGSIRVRLRQLGITEDAVRLVSVNEMLVVYTGAVVVPAAELAQVAVGAVRAALTGQIRTALPPTTTVNCPALQDVPVSGGKEYEVRVTGRANFSPLSDQVTVPLAVWSGGKLQQAVTARCTVSAPGEVAVLARIVDRHEALDMGAIRWENRNLAAAPAGVVTRSSAAVLNSWRMIYPQEAGVTLTWDLIESQPHALANEEVELVITIGAVRIADKGVLVKDARVGERVAARNSRTGAVVYGTLSDPQHVMVEVK